MNNRMKKLRKDILHMDQKEFSELIGISQSGLSDIERGQRGLSANVIERLAGFALKDNRIDITWLITGNRVSDLTEREVELLESFNKLDERGKQTIEAMLQYEMRINL